ncbi:hypothetical protein HYDPIDRAFT_33751 [Hydnomerulius pinastri MD-312]|uniref:Cytochrome P450 n=1 Tax=Hydnomerulius pinastri MD-312 TaxID=994086 RepID=A0A0C9W878_9AGAM|nr:hypothetical protein HYDPIDRAFT_33751 [Hydnomerulius pinastri MD-312]
MMITKFTIPLPTIKISVSFRVLDVLAVSVLTWSLIRLARSARRRARAPRLPGPPTNSFIFGYPEVLMTPDGPDIYEAWAEKYGSVYQIPCTLGTKRIVLHDPKAIAHFYARETTTYILTPLAVWLTGIIVGKESMLTSHGEVHKRQRKSLTPAFSVAAIRKLSPIFYDSVYKAKAAWDTILESSPDGEIIEVQQCLDTIGVAGFSHDFASLSGSPSAVQTVFESLANAKPSPLFGILFVLAHLFPAMLSLPNPRTQMTKLLNESMGSISAVLLERSRKEGEGVLEEGESDRSIIGLLLKAGKADSELHMSQEEIMAQMKVLLFAGYETTSVSLTWALIELCRDQESQTKLREELSQLQTDPTWDQLHNGLPYLDAVVNEVLRLHPPLSETSRVSTEHDLIPLSSPLHSPSSTATFSSPTHLPIPPSTVVTVPIAAINRSVSIWGSDAKEFKPARWIEEGGIPGKAKGIVGYKHLLTFADGPRTCLGKGFAVAEFKAVLSVLIRNYAFEFKDGPGTKTDLAGGVMPRPKIAGEEGSRVPLRVRRIE